MHWVTFVSRFLIRLSVASSDTELCRSPPSWSCFLWRASQCRGSGRRSQPRRSESHQRLECCRLLHDSSTPERPCGSVLWGSLFRAAAATTPWWYHPALRLYLENPRAPWLVTSAAAAVPRMTSCLLLPIVAGPLDTALPHHSPDPDGCEDSRDPYAARGTV